MTLAPQSHLLADLVARVLARTSAPLEQRVVTVEVPVDLRIEVDAQAFERVLDNLVTNAVKYSEAGSEVVLRALRVSGSVELAVQDAGFGIAEEDLARVFDRFYRVEGTARRRQGTGVGLAIVKQLVEAMGGSVRVDSVPGEGSTFTLSLPG